MVEKLADAGWRQGYNGSDQVSNDHINFSLKVYMADT